MTLPFLAKDPKAIEVVQVILETVLLRREKSTLDKDGKPIVALPSKEVSFCAVHCACFNEVTGHKVIIENLEFSPMERKIYDSLYNNAKQKFENWSDKGVVNKNYTSILAMLMRSVVSL